MNSVHYIAVALMVYAFSEISQVISGDQPQLMLQQTFDGNKLSNGNSY